MSANHKLMPYFDAGEDTTVYFHKVQSKYSVNSNPLLSLQSAPSYILLHYFSWCFSFSCCIITSVLVLRYFGQDNIMHNQLRPFYFCTFYKRF